MVNSSGVEAEMDTNSECCKLKREGDDHYESENYVKAKECYLKALASDPPKQILLSIHNNLTSIYVKDCNWHKVFEHSKKVLEIDPNNIRALFAKYRGLDAAEKYQEALDVMTHVCAMNMDDAMYLRTLDTAIMKASVLDAQEVVKYRTPSPRATNAVNAYFKSFCCNVVTQWWNGDWDQPSVGDLSENLKECQLEDAAGDTKPGMKEGGFIAARNDLHARNYSKIIDLCTDELKDPNSKWKQEAHLLRGTFKFLWGYREADVLEDLDAVIKAPPEVARKDYQVCALIKRGELFTVANKVEEMRKAYKDAALIQPENPDIYIQYCNSLMETDNSAEAYVNICKAVQMRPTFAYAAGVMCFLKFRIDVENGNEKAPLCALKAFQKFLAKFPNSSDLHLAFGYFFKDLREPCAAYMEFGKAVLLEPENTSYAANQCMMHFEITADAETCMAELRALLEKDDKNTSAYEALATLHIAMNEDVEVALQLLREGLKHAKARHDFLTLSILNKTAQVRKDIATKYMAAHPDASSAPMLRYEQLLVDGMNSDLD